jgi:hypothetical protein
VANSYVANQILQNLAGKYLRYQSHPAMDAKLLAIRGDYARALLSAVLQGV